MRLPAFSFCLTVSLRLRMFSLLRRSSTSAAGISFTAHGSVHTSILTNYTALLSSGDSVNTITTYCGITGVQLLCNGFWYKERRQFRLCKGQRVEEPFSSKRGSSANNGCSRPTQSLATITVAPLMKPPCVTKAAGAFLF